MRPKQHETTGSGDLFRARLEQIINLKHELVQLADKIDWAWIDGEIAPLYSDQGRPRIETRFAIGLLLLKHTYGLSDEGVCERWVHDPYFQGGFKFRRKHQSRFQHVPRWPLCPAGRRKPRRALRSCGACAAVS